MLSNNWYFKVTYTSAAWTTQKPLGLYESQQTRNFLKRWEQQTTLPESQETCI